MKNSVVNTGRMAWAALRMLLVLTVVTGVIYPLVVTGIGQVAFHDKANGSMAEVDGREVGSTLIGQSWNIKGTDKPDPKWFQGRPSNSGYDPLATGSGQLGADDPTLVKDVKAAKKQVAVFNGVPESEVPKDAVTGSASAIDPDISPQYADIQAKRVAEANGLSVAQVEKLVKDHTEGRTLGFLDQPRVNLLELNIALKELAEN
ncbi:potassium-transporting ATPase subunit KdpC [Streptomyces europaeiscabiei]|uniref:Potassium-transporting ATPase KdpC subunit n=1 Tax=Streptomyces europaeiscabiei TaxID=146819 RepID=A0ABU4NVJ8_9ACTN|nr:potassium-transporting ATPase subunit KdpC [Streptomyces europaeiscabiei]MDX2757143.1 potassium-transporting ATPase subunit KdpC [Streptomyces europaeiscabiei]MDX2766811.1 potassium-transporting ATPase subunit KdpC [Streptomyces europaeiscabiei]MDX3547518.1 potassium-transporting ATPase subunit KdpC [Streptomyces europaeiscabiei]MDX3557953.1 potassium-transporting ATPase subunit KdpC [Streptomyces europaeiscabiei]MDX3705590.1 potassium-transporting ATPase subunit KdpC [Streptomyces europaei